MRFLGAQVAVGSVVTRKLQGKSTNAQRTVYARRIHAAREKQIKVCAKDISYEREKEESTNVKISKNNTMSPVMDVDTFPPGEPYYGERGGLSIKETGTGNRVLYSQHKPPTQERIEIGQRKGENGE